MINLVILGAIIISIALGFKTKLNIGLFAMGFAYVIGCFGLGLKTSEVINLWPMSTFFVIFSVGMFYNFALVNGTMDKMAGYMLYATRKFPNFLPLIIFLATAFIAALGSGFFTAMALFCPMTLILCDKTGQNKVVGAQAVNWGALGGANLMTSGSGVIFQGLMKECGYAENSFQLGIPAFAVTMLYPAVLLFAYGLFMQAKGGSGVKELDVQRPEAFDKRQRQTLWLMGLTMFLALVFPILHIAIPENAILSNINAHIDIGLLCIIMTVVALFLKLGTQKEVIERVPWNTIIMICGVGMLIKVAMKAGMVDLIGTWISMNIPVFWLPVVIAVTGAIMSSFSSTLSVVAPSLFPVVAAMCEANPALNPAMLFACVVCGAQSSNISPFSSGGSMIQGSCQTDEERDWLFQHQIFPGLPICICSAAAACFVMSLLL